MESLRFMPTNYLISLFSDFEDAEFWKIQWRKIRTRFKAGKKDPLIGNELDFLRPYLRHKSTSTRRNQDANNSQDSQDTEHHTILVETSTASYRRIETLVKNACTPANITDSNCNLRI